MGIADAVDQIQLLVDEGCHQLGGVDVASAHFQKMGISPVKDLLCEIFGVIDAAYGGNGEGAVVGTYQQWLGLVVGDAAYA